MPFSQNDTVQVTNDQRPAEASPLLLSLSSRSNWIHHSRVKPWKLPSEDSGTPMSHTHEALEDPRFLFKMTKVTQPHTFLAHLEKHSPTLALSK